MAELAWAVNAAPPFQKNNETMEGKIANPFEDINNMLGQVFNAINGLTQKIDTVDGTLAQIKEQIASAKGSIAMPTELVSTEEAVKQLNVHKNTLMALIHNGDLPARKIGGRYKFMRSDLEKYVHDSSTRPEAAPAIRGTK